MRTVRFIVLAVMLVGTRARADIVPYIEPSLWAGRIVGPYHTDERARLAVGLTLRDRDELHLGVWVEGERIDKDVSSSYGGAELAFDVAIQPDLLCGARIAVGINADDQLLVRAGARATYHSIWLGLDVANTSRSLTNTGSGMPTEHTALELGLGIRLQSPAAFAYTAGVAGSLVLTGLTVLAIVATNKLD